MTSNSKAGQVTTPPDQIKMMAYLITAKRCQERGGKGPIAEDAIDIAMPMAEFLHAEGYHRAAEPASWDTASPEMDTTSGRSGSATTKRPKRSTHVDPRTLCSASTEQSSTGIRRSPPAPGRRSMTGSQRTAWNRRRGPNE